MVGLTREDFNFFNNTININKSWGYTKKMHEGFGPTKNEQSVRVIKMDRDTMDAFRKLFNDVPDNIFRLVFYLRFSKYKVISNNNANKVLRGGIRSA
jgi:integrase